MLDQNHRSGNVTMIHSGRGKRKHLNPSDCWFLSNSSEGAFTLTRPLTYIGTSRDLSRGLYPRDRKGRRSATRQCPRQRRWMHNGDDLTEGTTSGEAMASPSSSKIDSVFDPEDFNFFVQRNMLLLDSKANAEGCGLLSESPSETSHVVCIKTPGLEDAPVIQERNWAEGDELEVDPLPDSYFGLLGCMCSHALPAGHISQLPDEILRAVFFYLPAVDLYRLSSVSQQWHRVISDPMFVPYRKLYYRYRKGEASAVKEIDWILKENSIKKEDELCVLNLIKHMVTFHLGMSVNTEAVLTCLADHPLFKQSEASVAQTLPHLVTGARTGYVQALLAVIILLSGSVDDIQRLISRLQQPCSTLPVMELTEILYYLATLLFALREKDINISNRLHYNLLYTLYLMENPTNICRKSMKHLCSIQDLGRLDIRNIKLSPEQQQILRQESAPGLVIEIRGFAGTGKTTTLIEYARRRSHLRFLYVISTKPVQMETKRILPPNVECTTIHAMAYQHIGYKYQRKRKLMVYDLQPFAIFKLPEARGSFFRAKLICQSLCTFFLSTDETVTISHLPEHYKGLSGGMRPVKHQANQQLIEDTKQIWEKMVNLGETKENGYFMTRDGYLKLWQLSKPRLSQFDVILLDEAEDCSPVIMDIVLSQQCGKFLVGDPHQQISEFEGTVDGLLKAHRSHLFRLTQSFRFGPKIAYVAATILEVYKQVKDKTLVGGKQDGNIDNEAGQMAVLCRTNAAVFDEAVCIVTREKPSKIYIIGGLDKFGMNIILDIWMLMILEKKQATKDLVIRDPFIRIFEHKGGLRGLKDYAVEAEDKELGERIALVEKYGLGLPALIEKITSCSVDDLAFADVVLGTACKAKGYEFDTVQINNDLVKVSGYRHNRHMLLGFRLDTVPDIDWNLLYIAVTRAKRHLVMNKSLECLLSFAGEYFLKPELTSSLLREGLLLRCHARGCSNHIESETVLTLRKISNPQSEGEDAGGPLCCGCAKQRIGPLTYLMAPPELVKSMV
ncbi:F-box DNA helicase 1 isoform X1 [Chiloscyllium plagiosum]|uniref:F-box DNA helicase 1 isoform X1 n=1 Tax=Chiloscyllium plagiosum TaxID=36176 RepID=UPI001CB7B5D4|nr:F-box DNA helicase 1 isoform X1 [Chiloscyllium plagiosum]